MRRVKREDLQAVVQEALSRVPQLREEAALIALSGDLGAGKTTFTQALAAELGVPETVQSPTYVLMKSYPISYKGFTRLIHIDAYRFETPREFAALRPETFMQDPTALVVVEWPEHMEGALPAPDVFIKFSSQDAGEGERYIEVA